MPHFLLTELATIQMGYTFRCRLEPVIDSGVPVIQLKDLSNGDEILIDKLEKTENSGFKETHEVRTGDVIFRSRGTSMKSSIVREFKGSVVFASPLMRIRIENPLLLPEYLCWYINSPIGQTYLDSMSEGSAQKMVSKQNFEKMKIELPPIEIQRHIVEIAELSATETRLQQRIIEHRSTLITTQLVKMIKEQ